jgi:eukaryotic-like serine/threonine-protein kinase
VPAATVNDRSACGNDTGVLTEPGAVLGTPAYMSPEQRLGQAVDARADQYSFAKSLREALKAPIPPKLAPILARALATEPEDRYPAMAPLLDALARVRRGSRRRWLAAGGSVAVLAAVAGAWGFGQARSGESACERPTDQIATVWSAARRKALEAHLVAIDPAYGKQRFGAAAAMLDRGATRWTDQHVDACKVSRAGRQSGALLDRRMSCLGRALFEIGETVGVLERATNQVMLDDAMRAVGLPTLEACADVAGLTEMLPRPANPLQRTEADAIARETVDIGIALRAGGTRSGVGERARGAVERARKLGDPESLSRALGVLAEVQIEEEARDTAVGTLREAITSASAAHDDRFVVQLWAKLLSTLALAKKGRDAETLLPAAEAAVARTAARLDLNAVFLDAKAQVALANSNPTEARKILAEAIRMLENAGAATPGSPLAPQLVDIRTRACSALGYAGEWAQMVTESRALVPLVNAQYGPDHPAVLRIHFNLGVALRMVRDDKAALVEFREAARIGEARLAPSPGLADIVFGVGSTLAQLRQTDEAIAYLERGIAMARKTMAADDPRLNQHYAAAGAALTDAKRFEEGRKMFEAGDRGLDKLEDPDQTTSRTCSTTSARTPPRASTASSRGHRSSAHSRSTRRSPRQIATTSTGRTSCSRSACSRRPSSRRRSRSATPS